MYHNCKNKGQTFPNQLWLFGRRVSANLFLCIWDGIYFDTYRTPEIICFWDRPRAKSNHIFIIYNTYICIAHRIGDCIAHRSGGSGGAQLDVLIFIPSTVDCVCFCLRLLCQGDQGACGRPPTAPRILNQALLTQHCNICESLTCDAETGTHLSPPFIKS